MKISYVPVINFYELQSAIRTQYDVNIELNHLFPEYRNDSYESFYFRDVVAEYEDKDLVDGAYLAASYLADILPEEVEYCLISICW